MKNSIIPYTRLKASEKEVSLPVYIGSGLLEQIKTIVALDNYSRIAIITDKNVAYYWNKELHRIFGKKDLLIIVEAGEEHKNMKTTQDILTTLLSHNFDRKSLVINIGGGVICDMGAFAASLYMRGIAFVQVPTTLLAQTDAAIGGKTGVNFGELKNMIGTFAQPLAVICDIEFLSTLPEREYISGFAEIIKHALIADAKLLKLVSGRDLEKLDEKEVVEILQRSCKMKCDVVSRDVTEKGERKILNFGHTIGHAIEMASYEVGKPLLHGEAIAIGMVAEAKLSQLGGLLGAKEFSAIEKLIKSAGLPTRISKKLEKQIFTKIVSDKKNEKKKIKWVLLKAIGKALFDVEQPQSKIKQAIGYILA